ncbi:HAD family hydrolase [Candidatus Woesearchaeota archaeon]|nr:HAD family hydrolase [Candidatus Woesearchaeota archaeon]
MIKGVIFDWNGTLSDDTLRVFAVAMKTAKKVGGKPLRSVAEFKRKVRNPWYPFYRDDLGCRVKKAVIHKWFCYYLKREKIREKLFRDAIPLLRFLNRRNIKVGIVSSYPTVCLLAEVRNHGISTLLGFVRGDCHTKAGHIKDFLKHYKLRPEEVVFVGDMMFDIKEGRKCGVITAAYLGGVDSKSKLLPQKPDIVLPRLSALRRYVKLGNHATYFLCALMYALMK